jgi:hypothetical protein
MPKRPNFYCDFYCAAWDGLRGHATGRHGTGSSPLPGGVAGRPRWGCSRGVEGLVARSSGSRRAYKGVHHLPPRKPRQVRHQEGKRCGDGTGDLDHRVVWHLRRPPVECYPEPWQAVGAVLARRQTCIGETCLLHRG